MTKKKYIMTSGLVGITKNGRVFTTHYNKNLGGHYLSFENGGPLIKAYPEWDEKTLKNSTSDDLDIQKLWIVDTLAEYLELDAVMKTRTPLWDAQPTPKPVTNDVSPIPESVQAPEITVQTSISISINDKEVDFNNLSETEREILSKFGIL